MNVVKQLFRMIKPRGTTIFLVFLFYRHYHNDDESMVNH